MRDVIEVTVAEEGVVYVFPNEAAVEAWALHAIPSYSRTRPATEKEISTAVALVERSLRGER